MNNKANIKFESVNLFETMGGIVEAHTRAYKEDFDTDKGIFYRPQRKGRPGPFCGCAGLWERGCWTSGISF